MSNGKTKQLLNKLEEKYNNNPTNKELEIRILKVDKDLFKKTINEIFGGTFGDYTYINTHQIDIITNVNKYLSKRQIINYSYTTKKDVEYMEKKIISNVFSNNMKISLSSEKPVSRFSSNSANLFRFKNRFSFTAKKLKDWQIDLTIVNNISVKDINILKSRVNEFFNKNINIKDNFDTWPHELVNSYEIELEYTGNEKLIDVILIGQDFVNKIDKDLFKKKEQQDAIYKIATHIVRPSIVKWYLNKYNIKQLGNSPISLDKKTYAQKIIANIENYYLTDKADGERCIIFASETDSFAVTATKKIKISKLTKSTIIVDTELVDGIFYIFDVMYFNKNITSSSFDVRSSYLQQVKDELGTLVNIKPYIKLSKNYQKEIPDFYNDREKKSSYPIDGLIFISSGGKDKVGDPGTEDTYFKNIIYKWKPVEKLTIDFMIVRATEDVINNSSLTIKKGYDLFLLFCGIRPDVFDTLGLKLLPFQKKIVNHLYTDRYFPTLFSPQDNPNAYIYYHPKTLKRIESYKIGEFIYKDDQWELVKMRPDKDVDVALKNNFGNDFKTAEQTWRIYKNPLTLKDFSSKDIDVGYFHEEKSELHQASVGFNNFIKTQLINNFAGNNIVIDLASGHGQDLFRLAKIGVKSTLFIDKDINAIDELNKRKYSIENPMKVMTMVADLDKPFTKTIKKIKSTFHISEVDGIMINFAIHYFYKDITTIMNLILLIDSLLKKGGRVIVTCFNGKKIYDKVKCLPAESSWNLYDDSVLKYSIKKMFKVSNPDEAFTPYGKKIAVKLPFSGNEYYEEYLVDIDNLITLFEKKSYEVEINRSFDKYLSKFKTANKKVFDKLKDIDRVYSKYITALTFYKC
jgi:hypothetical protein